MNLTPLPIGVVTATYDRPDGSTRSKLNRVRESLLGQRYQHWKWFLVSDGYSDVNHLLEIQKTIPPEKFCFIGLHRNKETRVSLEEQLCNAGVEAYNKGLEVMLAENLEFGCQLTDDDYWYPDHLEVIINTFSQFHHAAVVYTQALYRNQPYPNLYCDLGYNNHPPGVTIEGDRKKLNQILTSMVFRLPCFQGKVMGRVVEVQGRTWPADMDLIDQIMSICQRDNLATVFVPQVTVFHETESWDTLAGDTIWKG